MKIFFHSWDSLIRLLISVFTVYPLVIIFLRLYGKRSLSKLNMFDFIVTVALGSVFAATITSDNVTVLDGAIAFLLLLSAQFIVTKLALLMPIFDKAIKSEPIIVFQEGEFQKEYMSDIRVTKEEILYAIRQKGIPCLNSVHSVIMETNGTMSVLKKQDEVVYSTLVGVKGANITEKSKNKINLDE